MFFKIWGKIKLDIRCQVFHLSFIHFPLKIIFFGGLRTNIPNFWGEKKDFQKGGEMKFQKYSPLRKNVKIPPSSHSSDSSSNGFGSFPPLLK